MALTSRSNSRSPRWRVPEASHSGEVGVSCRSSQASRAATRFGRAFGGIREGVSGKEIDSLARDIIAGAGYAENFGHGTGHSLGIEIHEFPRFSKNGEKDIMSAGMVMTVEPGIYLPGYGGVRIEDLVLVTPDGHEYLSAAPKSPLIKV